MTMKDGISSLDAELRILDASAGDFRQAIARYQVSGCAEDLEAVRVVAKDLGTALVDFGASAYDKGKN